MNVDRPDERTTPDPLGCADDFHRALARPELDAFDSEGTTIDADNERAALWLAVALGRCRLFGVDLGQDNGVLPQRTAIAAATECSRQFKDWTHSVYLLAREWEAGEMDSDCELEAGHFLFIRMDFWAAVVAIDEAYEASLLDNDCATGGFRRVIAQLAADGQTFDKAMQEFPDIFCTAAGTEMLENWRGLLAKPYGDALPWWLDRTLERVAEETEAKAMASQPSAKAWQKHISSRFDSTTVTENTISSERHETPVLRPLQETLNDLAEAFRRQFPETMLATAAASGEKAKAKVLWDSKQALAPVRCIVYQEPNGDLRLDFTSTEDTHENQTFEVVVKEQRQPTVTFRRDPLTGELFGETRIPRDELPEGGLSKLTFLLKKA